MPSPFFLTHTLILFQATFLGPFLPLLYRRPRYHMGVNVLQFLQDFFPVDAFYPPSGMLLSF